MAAQCAMRVVVCTALFAADFVILSSLNKSRAEDAVEIVGVGLLLYPLAYGVEHVPVDFDALVAECGVVECAEDVLHYFFDWDARVLPSVDNSKSNVLQDSGCDSAGNTVQLVGEMVL